MKRLLMLLLLTLPMWGQTVHTFPALDTDNTFTGTNTFAGFQIRGTSSATLSGKITLYHNIAPADDAILLGDGTAFQIATIPNCLDATGNHLNYIAGGNVFSCGTSTLFGNGSVTGDVLTVVNNGASTPTFQTPAGATCSITQVTTWWIDTTGNDSTGTGTNGNPWLTAQHAVDQIPGLVCGRYIIRMKTAGTYTGSVVLDGRVFAGGNAGGTNDSSLVEWPISDGNNPPAYSWVEILGDDTDTAPSTFIILVGGGEVAVADGNLILRALQVKGDGTGFGVHAAHAFVGLSGVLLDSNGTGILATEGSTIHVDNYDFVDPAFGANVLITNSLNYGFLISDDSLLTDYRSDGNNGSTNTILEVGGPVGTACGLAQFSRVWFRGTINCETGSATAAGLIATHSRMSIATMTNDGQSLGGVGTGGTGLRLESSQLSGAALGGANYTFQNFNGDLGRGVSLDPYSWIDSIPTLSGNTTDWFYNLGGPPSPINHPTYVANVTKLAQTGAIGTTTIAAAASGVQSFRVSLVVNCTVVGAGDTITPTVTYKDASNTTQTLTVAAADCTTLGAASIASINAVFRAKRSAVISYETAIATSPNYDITVTLELLTID